jgi:hypothetical protein
MSNTVSRSFVFPRPIDPFPAPFTTGPSGWLRDRDDDGLPDDLAIRLTVEADRTYPLSYWGDLLDIAARLGCQAVALPDEIAVPPGAIPPDGIEARILEPEEAHRLAVIARRHPAPAPNSPAALSDLRAFWTGAGALVDADGDGRGDGSRLRIQLPDPCPTELGLAAIELAARLGLETTALHLPLLLTEQRATDNELLLDCTGESPAQSVTLVDSAVRVSGSIPERAAALRFLAGTWPCLDRSEPIAGTSDRLDAAVRELVFNETIDSRVATLGAAAKNLSSGSTIKLTTADLTELAAAQLALPQHTIDAGTMPGGFTLEWTSEWELNEARSVVLHDAAAAIESLGDQARLLVLISEPPAIRAELEQSLALRFPEAEVRVRSAYKAGLSWLLEDIAPALARLDAVERVEITFPVFGSDGHLDLPIRWLQELYPGDELLARQLGLPVSAVTFRQEENPDLACYTCTAFTGLEEIFRDTFAPASIALPYVSADPRIGHVQVSTGVVRVSDSDEIVFEQALEPDPLRFWLWYQERALPEIGAAMAAAWGDRPDASQQPFFDAIDIELWISEQDARLHLREELDSPAEALHEDCYFGTLDWLQAFAAERGVANVQGPGAIRPVVHLTPGVAPRARVTFTPKRTHAALVASELIAPLAATTLPELTVTAMTIGANGLEAMRGNWIGETIPAPSTHPGDDETIAVDFGPIHLQLPRVVPDPLAEVTPRPTENGWRTIVFNDDIPPLLARMRDRPGVSIWQAGRSFEQRPIFAFALTSHGLRGRWSPQKLSARKPTVQIAARHHANEVSSTVAAFALADELLANPALLRQASIVVVPVENPDGVALHQALTATHQYWKHHPARYNAVGLEYGHQEFDGQTRFGESRIRREAWEKWRPHMVIDNHGVPSHEWSQHFSGFGSPPRFPVSYWIPQALLYGIIDHLADVTAERFGALISATIARNLTAEPALATVNDALGERYHTWGTAYVPERFPTNYDNGFLCYYRRIAPDPVSRNIGVRAPATTLLSWITEVPDETAHDERLELTARSQHLANRSAIDALIAFLQTGPP